MAERVCVVTFLREEEAVGKVFLSWPPGCIVCTSEYVQIYSDSAATFYFLDSLSFRSWCLGASCRSCWILGFPASP